MRTSSYLQLGLHTLVSYLALSPWGLFSKRNLPEHNLRPERDISNASYLPKQISNTNLTGVLNGITQGIKRTQSDINSWRGDQGGANLILDDSEYLYRDILEGTQVVLRTATVSTWDSASFLSPANNLNNALDGLINDLIKKKSQIDKINYTPIVRSQLLKLRDAADALTKGLFSKLPYAAAAFARPVSNLITAKLDKAITAFPLPSQGSGSWWPFGSTSSQPPPQVSGPSPYRNDPLPNQQSQPPPFPQQGQSPPPYQQSQPPPSGGLGDAQPSTGGW
jgi:hypothetical protein